MQPERLVQRAIRLPWPPSKLRPNSSHQGDWRGKASARKAYREACLWEIMAQRRNVNPDDTHLTLIYMMPDRRARDLDNLLAMTKQGIDALAEYTGINDKHFTFTLLRGEVVKGGAVCIIPGPPPSMESINA